MTMSRSPLFQPFPKACFQFRLKLFYSFLFCFVFLGFTLFCVPVRNAIYGSHVRNAWRDVKTEDVIRMYYFPKHDAEDFNVAVSCATEDSILGGKAASASPQPQPIALDPGTLIANNNLSTSQIQTMLSRGLGRFLPVLDIQQKTSAVQLYLILARALGDSGIEFFVTAGSLLGVVRHGGFIPWDDDFDLGIDVNDKKRARQALSCLQDAELVKFKDFHWKFHFRDQEFPFLDVFLFDKDERYVWSLTYYITITFLYPRDDVFPVTWARFEGSVWVPVPGQALKVARRIYDFDDCVAYKSHVKVNRTWESSNPNGYSLTNIPCRDLAQFYPMNHISKSDGFKEPH